MLPTPSTPTKKVYLEDHEMLQLLKTPKKEPEDDSYENQMLSSQLKSPKKELWNMSVFEQMVAEARANPHIDRDIIYNRHMGFPGSTQPLEEYMRLRQENEVDLDALYDDKKKKKTKKVKVLKAGKGYWDSQLPVSGKRDRKKTWKQLESEEMESPKAKKVKVAEPKPKKVKFAASTAHVGVEKPKPETARVSEVAEQQPKPTKKTPKVSEQNPENTPNPVAQVSEPQPNKEKVFKPKKTPKPVFKCPECRKTAKSGTCLCLGCDQWVHFKCAKITQKQYTPQFRCAKCMQ